MKQKFIALLVVMAALFTVFCSGSFAAERDSISVNGHASAEVAPDMATLYGNLEKRAAVAETARENLAKDMATLDRKSTRLNSSHPTTSRMPSSA